MYFSMNKLRYTVCNVHFSRFMKIFNGNSSLLKKVKSSGRRRGGSVGIKSISLELAGGFTFVFYGGPLRCFFIVFEQYGVINEQQEHRFCKVKLQTIRTAHIASSSSSLRFFNRAPFAAMATSTNTRWALKSTKSLSRLQASYSMQQVAEWVLAHCAHCCTVVHFHTKG